MQYSHSVLKHTRVTLFCYYLKVLISMCSMQRSDAYQIKLMQVFQIKEKNYGFFSEN